MRAQHIPHPGYPRKPGHADPIDRPGHQCPGYQTAPDAMGVPAANPVSLIHRALFRSPEISSPGRDRGARQSVPA